jgi:hypothetical protein
VTVALADYAGEFHIWRDPGKNGRHPSESVPAVNPQAISAFPNVNPGEGMKESKDIQKPQDHANDYNGVQNRLDGRCHWDEAIYQPQ